MALKITRRIIIGKKVKSEKSGANSAPVTKETGNMISQKTLYAIEANSAIFFPFNVKKSRRAQITENGIASAIVVTVAGNAGGKYSETEPGETMTTVYQIGSST